MPIILQSSGSVGMLGMCERIMSNLALTSPPVMAFRDDVRKIAVADHDTMLLSGIDRFGAMRAPLAKSTLAKKKRGSGPSQRITNAISMCIQATRRDRTRHREPI